MQRLLAIATACLMAGCFGASFEFDETTAGTVRVGERGGVLFNVPEGRIVFVRVENHTGDLNASFHDSDARGAWLSWSIPPHDKNVTYLPRNLEIMLDEPPDTYYVGLECRRPQNQTSVEYRDDNVTRVVTNVTPQDCHYRVRVWMLPPWRSATTSSPQASPLPSP